MEIEKNIYKIVLPLPFKPDSINCFLLRGGDGWDIIDTGLNYSSARDVWENFFQNGLVALNDIRAIYLTHYHSDHYGMAGWLQNLTGAPVYIHRSESSQVEQLWKKGRLNFPLVGDLFSEHGMPAALSVEVVDNMSGILTHVQPHPILSYLNGDEEIEMGCRRFRVLHTPGHSNGHICFFCKEDGILISGDHILPTITSNISLWPTSHPNPLELFLTSLEMTGCLPISKVLPAHGNMFTDCAARADQLIEHYRIRLALITDMAGSGTSAYNICVKVFGDDLSLHELRFAMAETLAHLAYLESRGRVVSRRDGGIIVYKSGSLQVSRGQGGRSCP